jgi:hypothetical protein
VALAIREVRKSLGQIGPDLQRVRAVDRDGREYDLPLAVGDRVRLFKSTNARFADRVGGNIGRNGSVLEVRAVEKEGVVLRAKNGREGFVFWRNLAGQGGRILLAYGDVMTINVAQGSTANEHILALPSGSRSVSGQQAYTAGTRHRRQAWIVTSQAAEIQSVHRALNDLRPVTIEEQWNNVAQDFAKQTPKDSAAAFIERVVAVRRGLVREFRATYPRAEKRMAQGLAASYLPERRARSRVEKTLRSAREHLTRAYASVRRVFVPRMASRSAAHDAQQQARHVHEMRGPELSL